MRDRRYRKLMIVKRLKPSILVTSRHEIKRRRDTLPHVSTSLCGDQIGRFVKKFLVNNFNTKVAQMHSDFWTI